MNNQVNQKQPMTLITQTLIDKVDNLLIFVRIYQYLSMLIEWTKKKEASVNTVDNEVD